MALAGLEPDAPTVSLNKLAAEIEPQSRPGDAVSTAVARAGKAAKEMCLLLDRDTDPRISDAHAGFLRLGLFGECDLERPSVRTIFDGIPDQVGENLIDAPGIDMHHQVRQCGRDGNGMLCSRDLEPFTTRWVSATRSVGSG